jgi:hypothetical protein
LLVVENFVLAQMNFLKYESPSSKKQRLGNIDFLRNSAQNMSKRKEISSDPEILTEKIKRCKINFTPGELR